jgi:CRP/FNR family cyclic AMP-dependent transcriptional regulator
VVENRQGVGHQGGVKDRATRPCRRGAEVRARNAFGNAGANGTRLAREALMHDQSGSVFRHLIEPSDRQAATAAGRLVMHYDRQLLAQCNLFRLLPANERATLIAHAHIRKYAAGETIFLMGSTGDSMMVVLSGRVRISVASPDGKEIMLAVLVAGEIFGEIAMLDGKERTADARAATECRLAILQRRDVLSFFAQHPNAWPGLVGILCERLRSADEQMAEIALMSIPVRLAKALLRMAALDPQSGKHLSKIRLSQRAIGRLIGARRESVNKWLGRWQRNGILQLAESLITIADRHALEELVRLGSSRETCCGLLQPPAKQAPRTTHSGRHDPFGTRTETWDSERGVAAD